MMPVIVTRVVIDGLLAGQHPVVLPDFGMNAATAWVGATTGLAHLPAACLLYMVITIRVGDHRALPSRISRQVRARCVARFALRPFFASGNATGGVLRPRCGRPRDDARDERRRSVVPAVVRFWRVDRRVRAVFRCVVVDGRNRCNVDRHSAVVGADRCRCDLLLSPRHAHGISRDSSEHFAAQSEPARKSIRHSGRTTQSPRGPQPRALYADQPGEPPRRKSSG